MLTSDDMKKLEDKFVTKIEFQKAIDQLLHLTIEGFNEVRGRLDSVYNEVRGNRMILGDHEKRINEVERKTRKLYTE